MASTTSLSPWTTLRTPGGKPASWKRSQINIDVEGSRSDGFRMNVFPQAMATGIHPHRDHGREVERRDAGDDAERLAVGPAVDLGADVAGELTFQEMGNAAGEIDDVDAACKLAQRVGVRLAVLGGDGAGDLVGMTVQELLEAEHVLDALQWRRRAPSDGGLLGSGDRGIYLFDSRQRQVGRLVAGRRIEDGREAPRRRRHLAAVDGVLDHLHGGGGPFLNSQS